MSQPLRIGVDFGSTGLRVAYPGDDGQPVVLRDLPASPCPWILCEPRSRAQSGGRLGISFPSLKSRLGLNGAAPLDGLPEPPADVVTRAFLAVKRSVEDHASRTVSDAVVTVPAFYSAAQRTALRDAILAAGFADVHLLNDSVAAVIAQTAHREGPATVLVYAMGYAGFELGLIRAAHGHYRALGYEGGSPAGWAFDELLLEILFEFAEERRLRLGTGGWDAARWLQVRAAAERVKEGLSCEERVAFPLSLETPEGKSLGCLSLDRTGFEAAIRPFFNRTFDQIASLLEQASMTADQVDTILLVGGSTCIPALQSLVASTLGRQPVALDREALVRGAVLFAAQQGARPLPAGTESEGAGQESGEREIPADLGALRAALSISAAPSAQASGERLVLVANELPADSPSRDVQALLLPVTRLLEQGRSAEARALLEDLIREAQALSAKTEAPGLPAPPTSSGAILARRAFIRAQQLLKKGKYEEAVGEAHVAWHQDPDSPDTFEKMIDIHCQAALASSNAADAQRWLVCAHAHDAGNIRVRQLMAEQHYLHARQLAEQGQHRQSLDVLDLCFAWNPEHEGARELQSSLTNS